MAPEKTSLLTALECWCAGGHTATAEAPGQETKVGRSTAVRSAASLLTASCGAAAAAESYPPISAQPNPHVQEPLPMPLSRQVNCINRGICQAPDTLRVSWPDIQHATLCRRMSWWRHCVIIHDMKARKGSTMATKITFLVQYIDLIGCIVQVVMPCNGPLLHARGRRCRWCAAAHHGSCRSL